MYAYRVRLSIAELRAGIFQFRGKTPSNVILNAVKNLAQHGERLFASLRVTQESLDGTLRDILPQD